MLSFGTLSHHIVLYRLMYNTTYSGMSSAITI
nr:MAG TPA: hypothetical protein [Caudoviricetes sp.]